MSGAPDPASVRAYRHRVDARAYAAHLRRDGFDLAGAAEGHLDRPVAACPGWDLAELVWHTGEVHHFWREVVARGLQDPAGSEIPARPSDTALTEWLRRGVESLAETLEHADPHQRVWTWAPQKDIAFVQRRMAQETAVHRWDAETATGDPRPIEPELAADGIDEFLTFFLPGESHEPQDPAASVHLHATDAAGEWLVELRGRAIEVTRAHSKADAAARATASELLLLLWRRVPPADVEVFGDDKILERFLALSDLS